MSPFFRLAFGSSHFIESQNCEIRFDNLTSTDLQSIVEYVETGKLSITAANNPERVFLWADYLMIDELIECSAKTIIADLNVNNAIRLYRLGGLFDSVFYLYFF